MSNFDVTTQSSPVNQNLSSSVEAVGGKTTHGYEYEYEHNMNLAQKIEANRVAALKRLQENRYEYVYLLYVLPYMHYLHMYVLYIYYRTKSQEIAKNELRQYQHI